MRSVRGLWRGERQVRWFFVAHLQGGLGDVASCIALMLLAYERIGSAWAATVVLLADVLPAMFLSPLLGGLIDRTSRLGCAIFADLLRAAAFAGLMFTGGIAPMIALALVVGLGNALFRPATSALLPSLVADEHLPAANALYSMVRDAGQLLGPACAAGLLLLAGPELVIGLSAITFALSGVLLTRLRGHVRVVETDHEDGEPASASTLAGIRSVLRDRTVRTLMGSSGAVILVAGTMNVAELVLAEQDLGYGHAGYALLLSAYGCGMVAGSLLGARNDGLAGIRRRYLAGLALVVAGLAGSALAPTIGFAMLSFAVTGVGNSLFVVSDRVLLQRLVPEHLHGRAFGVLETIGAWGCAGAVLAGGLLASTLGGRATFAIAGAGMLLVLLVAARALSALTAPRPVPSFGLSHAAR